MNLIRLVCDRDRIAWVNPEHVVAVEDNKIKGFDGDEHSIGCRINLVGGHTVIVYGMTKDIIAKTLMGV